MSPNPYRAIISWWRISLRLRIRKSSIGEFLMGVASKGIVVVTVCLSVLACASTPPVFAPPEVRKVDFPPINTTHEVEVGETIVEQTDLRTYKALYVYYRTPRFGFEGPLLSVISSGGRLNDGESGYCGNLMEFLDGGRKNQIGIVCTNLERLRKVGRIESEFDEKEITLETDKNFQRRLIYTGKSGSNIFISYREFRNDLARPAFTQDLTFDLNEGRMIGFKGARFEVESATNIGIRYRMIASFPDRQ